MPPVRMHRHMRAAILAPWFAASALVLTACPSEAVRILNHNLLNWSGASGQARLNYMRAIARTTGPDLVVCQEVLDQAGVDLYRDQVLNFREPGQWSSAPFTNGPDTDNGLFYRTSKWDLLDTVEIPTVLRNVSRYHLRLDGYTTVDAEIYIYSFHLKASMGAAEEQQRLTEMQTIRANAENLPFGSHILFCGDYNVYTGSEPAFQYALSSIGNNVGRVKDPINRVGPWHDNLSFADVHTQSPRTAQFGGGANGGMDDRFDFLLESYNLDDGLGLELLEQTYTAFGNDGRHFNQSIDGLLVNPAGPADNLAVGLAMADSLEQASDHLPVFADVRVPAEILVPQTTIAFGTVIVGAVAGQALSVSNPAGVPGEDLSYTFDIPVGFGAPGGTLALAPGQGTSHPITLDTSSPGVLAADLGIFSNAPDSPFLTVALSGTVLAHAAPSSDSLVATVLDTLDFGVQASGGFNDQPAFLYNAGYGALQARLRVTGGAITGGAGRFTLVEPVVPALIELEPGRYDVHFDDVGASTDSTYEASLALASEDDPALPGAVARPNVTYVLRARVTGGVVAVEPGTDALPSAIAFYPPSPNPSAGAVRLRFDLPHSARVEMAIYDVAGRRVAVVAEGEWGAGTHSLAWDGRNAAGRVAPNGVYFARFVVDGFERAQRFVRMR